ncbi:MAG: efflux RND transporter periplasmic adaptor subunit [Candidatus Eisenbacteria bacterium]
MRTSRRALGALPLLRVATILALGVSACSSGEKGPPSGAPQVKVVAATQKDVPISKEWVGEVKGAVDIEVRANVDGWLQGMHFKEGTEVEKGTLLYTIDTSELEQAVATANAKLAQAKTLFAKAESDLNRYRPLAAAGAVSQRDLESALAEYGARKSEVDAAEASLRLSEINFGYARITAPIDGLIGMSAARVGDFVGRPPNPLILNTISRIDSVDVRFSITEQEYLALARKLQASTGADRGRPRDRFVFQLILADGSRYPYTGTVSTAQREIDPATGTLQFEASFPNPDRLLRPGQFARIVSVVDVRKGAVVVPSLAVMELQGQYLVLTVGPDSKVGVRRIEAGPSAGAFTVIDRGIAPGEKVIVEGMQRVRPDMAVQAIEVPPDSIIAKGRR